MFFHKNKDAQIAKEDRDLIAENSKMIEVLLVLCKGREEEEKALKELEEKMKYLQPSTEDDVLKIEKKIKNQLADLKIALVKEDGEFTDKMKKELRDLEILVAERNAKI